MKPTLKKVSKYENKFAKLQKKAAEFNFRNQLKQVKKKEFTLEEEDKEVRTTVFNRIFASRRREYFFAKLFFSCPSKVYSKRSLNLSKNILQRYKLEFSFYINVFWNMYIHLEFSSWIRVIVYLLCLHILYFCEFKTLIDKFTSTVFEFLVRDATFYSRTTGRWVV